MTMREVLDKLRSIDERLEKLEKRNLKRGLNWKASLPPRELCRDIVSAYNLQFLGNFDYEMQRLAEFYGIVPMENRHSPAKVPAKAIACYHSFEGIAYYKKSSSTLDTVLHEFFHHLHAKGVVSLYSDENQEKCADEFSRNVILRGKEP